MNTVRPAPAHPAGRWVCCNETYRSVNENAWYNELEERIAAAAASGRYTVAEKNTFSSLRNEQVQKALAGKDAIVLQIAEDFSPVYTLVMTSDEYLRQIAPVPATCP